MFFIDLTSDEELLLRDGIEQVSAEGVLALGVSTQLSARQQLHIHLTASSELQKNRLRAAVLRILTVIFPGRGDQLVVLHQLHLLVEPLTGTADAGVRREGEGVEASARSRERACEESDDSGCELDAMHESNQEISLAYSLKNNAASAMPQKNHFWFHKEPFSQRFFSPFYNLKIFLHKEK